ncbi:Gp37-like protein [Arthrobacter rhombi]|uniref:Gp37-like protein n=1 Tax=Arthrobacter rhombi TaxID=71253 RepID=UPI003FD65F78
MVYNKLFKRRGSLGAPTSVEFELVNNSVSLATVVVPLSRPRVKDALNDGARLVIDADGMETFSGKVVGRSGSGFQDQSVTLTVESDWRLFNRLQGWPVPDQPIGQQGVAYRKYTGKAETILKDAVREAAARIGEPITVAPDMGRGKTINGGIQFRFHPLADRLFPAVEQAGLSVTVVQDGENGLVVDVREPQRVRKPFSAAAGNLVEWEWSNSNPTATSVVVGGQGAGELRTLLERRDTTRISQYGDHIEAFVDARDTDDATELTGRMDEAMEEGAAKTGLSLTLANTKSAIYGTHYRVGDLVTVQAGQLLITDSLKSAKFSWTRDKGMVVAPQVGERTDDPDLALAKRVRKIWQGLTDLKVGK